MVKKLGILGFILVAVAAASMVWAGSYNAGIVAPQPTVMPATAPACVGPYCPPVAAPAACPPVKMKAPKKKKWVTSIDVKMKFPAPPAPVCAPPMCGPPPIPVAVPMWKFIVPWPPFVYYLPVE